MNIRLENAYKEFCGIVTAESDRMIDVHEINEFSKRLGHASVAFENLLYEEMGMSCEDIAQCLQRKEYGGCM